MYKYFLPVDGLSFPFLIAFFEAQKFFILMKPVYLFLLLMLFMGYLRNYCQTQYHKDINIIMFSSMNFIDLALTFSSVVSVELIFIYGVR